MSLVLRIGRWSFTFFAIAIDEESYEEAPVVLSTSATTEVAAGFTPPEPWWDDED